MTTTAPALSPDQQQAHDAVHAWWRARAPQVLTLGGFAGCGKTFLTAEIARTLKAQHKNLAIGFSCFTGKASLVLRGKLRAADVLGEDDYCGTLHGLIYKPKLHLGRVVGWARVPAGEMPYALFILDEASMIDEAMLKDLASYGKPILAVGDHGQLPPVKGAFNLMESPVLRLEKIHRQAEDSPIIRLSMMARLGEHIKPGSYGPGVYKTTDASVLDRLRNPKAGLVLCGTNRTRTRLNALLRRRAGHASPLPEVGERVVCLRNQHDEGVYNGMVGELAAWTNACPDPAHLGADRGKKTCDLHAEAEVVFPDAGVRWRGAVLREQFGAAKTVQDHPRLKYRALGGLFDYGYCLTVHKSQGSEANSVVLVDEADYMDEEAARRWRYTGITRARESLCIIGR